MIGNLIYDIGMNNGDDTAYYLQRGFRVIAVEANPALVSQAIQRFEREVAEDRLVVLNVGIAEQPGNFASGFARRTRSGVRLTRGSSHGTAAAPRHNNCLPPVRVPS